MTSRIRITRGGPAPWSGGEEGEKEVGRGVRNLPSPSLTPLGMRVGLHQQRDTPSSSHPLPPHLTSARAPLPLSTTPVRKSALGGSSLRPVANSTPEHHAGITYGASLAGRAPGSGTGPPVSAVRAILRRNREGVEDVGRPVQGMLFSLEQGGGSGVWPEAGSGLGDGGG